MDTPPSGPSSVTDAARTTTWIWTQPVPYHVTIDTPAMAAVGADMERYLRELVASVGGDADWDTLTQPTVIGRSWVHVITTAHGSEAHLLSIPPGDTPDAPPSLVLYSRRVTRHRSPSA